MFIMKRFVKLSLLFAVMTVVMSSCNCFKKMLKNIDSVEVTTSPEIVTLKGKNAVIDVTVNFPAKYFDGAAVLKMTPVLVYEGGEIVGTPKFVQGESVEDNYTVIAKATGGSYTQTVSIPYEDAASISTLEIRVEAKCTGKCKESLKEFTQIGVLPVAQGVRTTSKLANNSVYMTYMKDDFQRVKTYNQEAEILYDINRYKVNKVELSSDQIEMFEKFVEEYSSKERTTLGNVYAKGYASPDGPLDFNDKLAKQRSESGQEAVAKSLSSLCADIDYDIAAYGEDWDGFKELVAASNMKDKDLILQVLAMYSSPVERDQQIQNMTAVFTELKDNIFPPLRRTKFVVSADVSGKTDEELVAAAKGNVSELDLEEALFAATLVKELDVKVKVYKYAAEKFNCARAYNNYAVASAKSCDWATAKTAIDKAASMSKDPIIANNMAAVAIQNGDFAKAKDLLAAAKGPEAQSNQSLLKIAEGEPTTANLKGYNLAVAELCLNNPSAAAAALATVDCPCTNYVSAVIAMREGKSSDAIASLKKAIAYKPAMKAKAAKDIEFVKLFGTTEFEAL